MRVLDITTKIEQNNLGFRHVTTVNTYRRSQASIDLMTLESTTTKEGDYAFTVQEAIGDGLTEAAFMTNMVE